MSTRSMNIRMQKYPDIKYVGDEHMEYYRYTGRYIDETCEINFTIRWESTYGRSDERFETLVDMQRAVCEHAWDEYDFVMSLRHKKYLERKAKRAESARIHSMGTLAGMLNTKSLEALQQVAG